MPTEETGTISLEELDVDMYANMMGDEGTYENAVDSIGIGDFVTLYVSTDEIKSGNDVYYGEITDYDKDTELITYKEVEKNDIEESMDLYSEIPISGSDIISDEECEQLENVVQTQMEDSGFGEEAADILCDMVTKTDGFKENTSLQSLVLTDENGQQLSAKQLRKMNVGKSFELTDDVKLSVEIINKGEQLLLTMESSLQLVLKLNLK